MIQEVCSLVINQVLPQFALDHGHPDSEMGVTEIHLFHDNPAPVIVRQNPLVACHPVSRDMIAKSTNASAEG
jgi:hypothetical protein